MTALMIDTTTTISGRLLPFPMGLARPTSSRISLVATPARRLRDWSGSQADSAIVFHEAATNPASLLPDLVTDGTLDVERLVLDGGITTRCFLNVLASAPHDSTVDILWICDDGTGYLSAVGRGGDRVLYALGCDDVRFYLEVNDLVDGHDMLEDAD